MNGAEMSTEVLATLAEIGEEVNASLDLDEVLARTAALIKRHIDYEIFGVLMIEGDGSYLRRTVSRSDIRVSWPTICESLWGRELREARRRRAIR